VRRREWVQYIEHKYAVSRIPVTDRVGRGTEAWQARRQELLAEWHAELAQADAEDNK
jgi:hypothetical protein